MTATPLSVAAAGASSDDMPPVLFLGSGCGPERGATADAALSLFLDGVRASGRMVAFDRIASDPGALDDAIVLSGFDTSRLSGRRQVCVLRRVDELPPSEAPRLKRVASSYGQWWAASAGGGGGVRTLQSFFLPVRAPRPLAEEPGGVPDILGVRDVPKAVASGASIAQLAEAFRRFAAGILPPGDAGVLAARLDLDARTNKRPLMLSALIEDAVRDAIDDAKALRTPGGSRPTRR